MKEEREMGKRKNITLTEERHDDIFKVYEEVVASYGETAKYMTKSAFYEETAARVKFSSETVRKIVAKRLHGRRK